MSYLINLQSVNYSYAYTYVATKRFLDASFHLHLQSDITIVLGNT